MILKLLKFLISRVPETLNFDQDIPLALSLTKILLYSPYMRHLFATWLVDEIISLNTFEPANQAVSTLETWLKQLKPVNHTHLRRLCLIFFLHLWSYANYYGQNFTTIPAKNGTDLPVPFKHSVIFAIYNIVSNGQPIINSWDFREQIGGFPPRYIDPVQYLVNYLKGNQKLRIELNVEKDAYEFGGPVQINLLLKNLTDSIVILDNETGTTVKIVAEPTEGPIQEQIYETLQTEATEDNGISLQPREQATIKWDTIFQEKSVYIITAQIHIPHYQGVAELLIGGISYGENHSDIVMPGDILIQDFCTL
jgi:hypothetical protein